MARLLLLLVLAVVAGAAVWSWRRGARERRRDERLRNLRSAFLHGARAEPATKPAALTDHEWCGLNFALPASWRVEEREHGSMAIRVGVVSGGLLRVGAMERGPERRAESSAEPDTDAARVDRWFAEQGHDRVRFGWHVRPAAGDEGLAFVLELASDDAVEPFAQADVATIDRALRAARFV